MRSASVPCGFSSTSTFAAEHLLLEELVFADVGGDHLADLVRLAAAADAEIRTPGVIGDHGEVLCARAEHRGDQIFGDAAQRRSRPSGSWRRRANRAMAASALATRLSMSRFPEKRFYCKSRRIL